MGGWKLLMIVLLAAAGVALLVDRNRRQYEKVYAQSMRRSMLYYEIYALVTEARKYEIDRVQIERNRIVFYAVYPPGKIGEYALSEHGHRPLNPQRTLALVQTLMEDLPILQENRYYRLQRYAVVRPNGRKDYGYQFIIRSNYKTKLMYARQQPWIG